jgi:tetratricopeptide (TPR) repeat protein
MKKAENENPEMRGLSMNRGQVVTSVPSRSRGWLARIAVPLTPALSPRRGGNFRSDLIRTRSTASQMWGRRGGKKIWDDVEVVPTKVLCLAMCLLVAVSTVQAVTPSPETNSVPATNSVAHSEIAPSTPREFFNAGTEKLQAGKLREAEAFLESSLSSQIARLQPPALYNLGSVRYGQGAEELKKTPPAGRTAGAARGVAQQTDEATRLADEALKGNDVQQLLAAYMRGRGQRKQLKAATEAVRRALDVHGTALRKWERSLGDFKSTLELNPSDADAQHNADVLDRSIAKLIDSLRELQQAAAMLSQKGQELGEKMKQMKGKIPASQMPPGAAGDDDDDEENPFGPKPGEKEGATKEGEEMKLSPEQAGWILEGFKLDGERRLPMGQGQPGQPRDRSKPTW